MKTSRLVPALALLAILPIIPYAIWGYAGHDYAIHLKMWMELRSAWRHGELVPGWCPLANFTLGSPRFCFYPPLSFLVGAVLSLALPFRLAPAAFVWLVTLASGLSMYRVSRFFVKPDDRFAAAVLYMWSPYLLFTAITRFAAAELLMMAWTPFLLLYFYRAIWEKQKRAAVWLGCLLGISWLTNIPAAIVVFYVFLIVAGIAAARHKALSPILHYAGAQLLGVALAAFFLAPSYFEQKWISPAAIVRPDLKYFFIFASHSYFHGGSRFVFDCWAIACVEIVIIAACAYNMRRLLAANAPLLTWIELTIVAFTFQLPISMVLWRSLPELLFAGFPFRFLSIMGAALPLVLLAGETPRSLRKPAYCLLCITALFPFVAYARQGLESPNPRFSDVIAKWQKGYAEMAEFMPVGTSETETAFIHLTPISVVDGDAGSDCKAHLESTTPQRRVFSVYSAKPCRVRLALFFYPFWRAIDETGTNLPVEKTARGLLIVAVPPGRHRVEMKFKVSSPLRSTSILVSLSSALLVILLLSVKDT